MATTKAPLFGLDASGTIAGALVFSKWRGRTYVRRHAVPSNPRSALQVGMRAVFKYVTQAFGSLSTSEKAEWDALAAPTNITQLNAQVKDAQRRARQNLGWRIGPDEAAGVTPDAPTGLGVTAANKALVLAWTRPVGNQGDYTVAIHLEAAGLVTCTIDNLVMVMDVATITVTVTGLTNGTLYFARVREMNTDGEFGTQSESVSGTPAA